MLQNYVCNNKPIGVINGALIFMKNLTYKINEYYLNATIKPPIIDNRFNFNLLPLTIRKTIYVNIKMFC